MYNKIVNEGKLIPNYSHKHNLLSLIDKLMNKMDIFLLVQHQILI